jgi:HSP20 family molecular chaperone IbpA
LDCQLSAILIPGLEPPGISSYLFSIRWSQLGHRRVPSVWGLALSFTDLKERLPLAKTRSAQVMSRLSMLNSPLLLGFDQFERSLERVAKASTDGYPPYNIERVDENRLRITLAVAGFAMERLEIVQEANQLTVRGDSSDASDEERVFLHRGIASRAFRRSFVIAEGIEIDGAILDNGMLHIDLIRPTPSKTVRTIEIKSASGRNTGKKKPQTIDINAD